MDAEKLRQRILPIGTKVIVTTYTEDGPVTYEGKVKRILNFAEKKYLVHKKCTEILEEVQDVDKNAIDLNGPEGKMFQDIAAYDKYGRKLDDYGKPEK